MDTAPDLRDVPASLLLAGDELPATQRAVVRVTSHGPRIPTGKCEVVLRDANGTVTALWPHGARIGVRRAGREGDLFASAQVTALIRHDP